jgi:hypothetical protein
MLTKTLACTAGECDVTRTWPEIERRSVRDRRDVARGERRRVDLPDSVQCPRCPARNLRALGYGLSGFWWRCGGCQRVWVA